MEPQKPHIVCLPSPYQGHLNPMIKLANILHSRGFYITIILTEYNYATLISSIGEQLQALKNLDNFGIETIPDGLPSDKKRGADELQNFVLSIIEGRITKPLREILKRLLDSDNVPRICGVISDVFMYFALEVGRELGIPVFSLNTTSTCIMLGLLYLDELVRRGYFPLKDESYLTNGYLDTQMDWVPGLNKGAKLKHLSNFIQSTNSEHIMFKLAYEATKKMLHVDGIIFNTCLDLEGQVLDAMKDEIPKQYVIGPLSLLISQDQNHRQLLPRTLSLWKEDHSCLEWLNKRSPKSVIYVNFGSLVMLTPHQLKEFAWGLANANHPFLWVIVKGASSIVSDEYMEGIREKGLILSWCPQEKVLQHPSIAVFLTHCGWNSMLESICEGVPMICWPQAGDQQMNCLYACQEWKIGVEMEDGKVNSENVEILVREMMEGEKGKELKINVLELKNKVKEATIYGGSSHNNFNDLVNYLMERVNGHQSTPKCVLES